MNIEKKTKKRACRAAFTVFAVAAAVLISAVFFIKRPLSVGGYSLFIVSSASMEPEYRVCSLVLIKNVPIEELVAGDTVVYKSDALNGGLAFHRIIKFVENGFYTKGDNNAHEDRQLVTKASYVGKGIFSNYALGFYISSVQTPSGFILLFASPAAALFLCCRAARKLRSF